MKRKRPATRAKTTSDLILYNVDMRAASLCVYCRKQPEDPRYRPFCSDRCKMADLGRWLGGDYRVGGPLADHALDSEDSGEMNDASDDAATR